AFIRVDLFGELPALGEVLVVSRVVDAPGVDDRLIALRAASQAGGKRDDKSATHSGAPYCYSTPADYAVGPESLVNSNQQCRQRPGAVSGQTLCENFTPPQPNAILRQTCRETFDSFTTSFRRGLRRAHRR